MDILLISKSKKINNAILGIAGHNFDVIDDISQIDYRIDYKYDLVIINDTGLKIEELNKINIGVLFLANKENYKQMRVGLYQKGGFAITKPTSIRLINETLKLMGFFKKKANLDKNYYRILYAKYFLIKYKLISENEAHKYIIDRAMTLRKSKNYVAEEIINYYEGVENND